MGVELTAGDVDEPLAGILASAGTRIVDAHGHEVVLNDELVEFLRTAVVAATGGQQVLLFASSARRTAAARRSRCCACRDGTGAGACPSPGVATLVLASSVAEPGSKACEALPASWLLTTAAR